LKKYINILITSSILIFTIFYNIGATLLLLFHYPPFILNFSSKFLALFCSLFLIIFYFKPLEIRLKKSSFPLLIFLFIYGVRIIIDMYFRNLISGYPNYLILSYYFGGIITLIVAIISVRNFIKLNFIMTHFVKFLCFANISIFILLLSTSQLNLQTLFSQRLSFGIEENETFDIINSITISINAALLLLYFIFCNNFSINFIKINNPLKLFLIIVSILNLILSGSRGPLFSLIIITLLIYIQGNKSLMYLFFKIFIFVFIFFILLVKKYNLNLEDLNYIQRIYSNNEFTFIKDDNRKELYNSAYNQFIRNPIFGDKYYEEITKTYPHNIFLEILMSTGIFGIVFFILHLFTILLIYFKNFKFKNEYTFLIFITIFYLLCSLFSSSIWGNLEFFIFSSLLYYSTASNSNILNE